MRNFELINYSPFKIEKNSMFEEDDVSSELRYRDLCISEEGVNIDYDGLIIEKDIVIENAKEDDYLFKIL
jgi:hypothetical protein